MTQRGAQLLALEVVGMGEGPPDEAHRHDVLGVFGGLRYPRLRQKVRSLKGRGGDVLGGLVQTFLRVRLWKAVGRGHLSRKQESTAAARNTGRTDNHGKFGGEITW
jgi:hypothetical protein